MGKIRRGGFVFLTWVGDHAPYHVHVFKDDRLVVKWDLERGRPIKGDASARLRKIIASLREEGAL